MGGYSLPKPITDGTGSKGSIFTAHNIRSWWRQRFAKHGKNTYEIYSASEFFSKNLSLSVN
jgi:hypothetical protein